MSHISVSTTVSVERDSDGTLVRCSTLSDSTFSACSGAPDFGGVGGGTPAPDSLPFVLDTSVDLEYTLIQPIDEAELLDAELRGWVMPTVLPDNEHVPRASVDAHTFVQLPLVMSEKCADRLTRDLPTSGRQDTFVPSRALRKHPFPDRANVPPPLRHSPFQRLLFSISRSGSQGSLSSKRSALSAHRGNSKKGSEHAQQRFSVRRSTDWPDAFLGLVFGYSPVSPYPRMYESSTRVDLAYIAHPLTKSTYLVLVDTRYRISTPFYAHCGDRLGDFVIKSFERGYRGFFAYSIERRDPDGVATAFYDPRILLVPRALVEREYNILEFAEEEARIIREEWIMFPEGQYTARIDAALELGYGVY